MVFRSLQTLKYFYLTPLQQSYQMGRVKQFCPEMAPVLVAYQRHYQDILEATSISVDEREQKGWGNEETLTYGETYWTSFLKILKEIEIQKDDVFIDLGCGTGALCFLINRAYGIPVLGIDLVEAFVQKAQDIVETCHIEKASFLHADFFTAPIQKGSIYYITCTCFPRHIMKGLTELLLKNTLTGDQVITVTHAIKDHRFKQVKSLKTKFSWGTDEVFICRRL